MSGPPRRDAEEDPEGDLILGADEQDERDAPGAAAGRAPAEDDLDEDMVLGTAEAASAQEREVPAHVPRDAFDDEVAASGATLSRWHTRRIALQQDLRRRVRRARSSFPAILATTVTCALAYVLSQLLLDQPRPVVAPILVWVAMGIQRDRPPRRVAELAAGATVGVAVGDLLSSVMGNNVGSFVVIMLVAGTLGRLLDSAELFTSQLVIQAMFLAAMPADLIEGGPLGRLGEAVLGLVLAILASTFARRDVRRRPRHLGSSALADLAAILEMVSAALKTGESRRAVDALTAGRGTQNLLDDWAEAAETARDIVRLNPALRAQRGPMEREVVTATLGDRAVRNARVVARLSIGAVAEEGANPLVADHVARLAAATRLLSHAHRHGHDPQGARKMLESVSRELSPVRHRLPGWRMQMVETLLRSLAVDLMQVSGKSDSEAQRVLPS